jgi:transposase
MSTTHASQQAREWRRRRAWELKRRGWKQKDIAAALAVTEGAVSQWMKRARQGGPEALRHRPPPGPRPRLSDRQKRELPAILARGAEAWQWRGDVWTTRRVAAVIRAEFGVRYHPAHVSRLLRQLGWSPQKPIRRASPRDEAAIQAWLGERWPALKKTPTGRGERSCG